MSISNPIATFVKFNRGQRQLTQEQLAEKAGVGLRFVRDLEQGKASLRLDKVNQVLALFGSDVVVGSSRLADPYDILLNYYNKPVRIYLKNKNTLKGRIVSVVRENAQIAAWNFVEQDHVKKYQQSKDQALLVLIAHQDIDHVENL